MVSQGGLDKGEAEENADVMFQELCFAQMYYLSSNNRNVEFSGQGQSH